MDREIIQNRKRIEPRGRETWGGKKILHLPQKGRRGRAIVRKKQCRGGIGGGAGGGGLERCMIAWAGGKAGGWRGKKSPQPLRPGEARGTAITHQIQTAKTTFKS